tara:strand:- start:27853 stop:28482 length:630 start_codon:yes stop_codon:yes gene_type:complete
MKKNIKFNLHGNLGESLSRKEWNVNVGSVAEGIHAINMQSDRSIQRFFLKQENMYARYKVLVNDKEIPFNGNLKENELTMMRNDIDTVDIIPVLEGAGWENWLGIGLGMFGMYYADTSIGMMASLALFAFGISNMLSEPPDMPENRQITNPSSDPTALANSYLFNGPVNVLNDGGPVPIGYGRLIVGSQTIMASYGIKRILTKDAGAIR